MATMGGFEYDISKGTPNDLEVDGFTTEQEFIAHIQNDSRKYTPETGIYVPPFMVTCTQSMCVKAASIGRTDLLHAAYESGLVKQSKEVFTGAARGGYIQTLKYLKSIDCPWDEKTAVAAAESGDIDVLQWLVENGCPCNGESMIVAASIGHLGMISFLHYNIHPINVDIVDEACSSGATYIVEWARSVGVVSSSIFTQAICDGDIGVLDDLRKMRYPWDMAFVDEYMVNYDIDAEVVEWLRSYGYMNE